MSTTPYRQWTASALCLDVMPELFFAEDKATKEHVIQEYCRKCPVRQECRDFAIDNQFTGIYGYKVSDRNREAKFFGRPSAT